MGTFAKLDENNVVIEVICVANDELLDESGSEVESKGVAFLSQWSGGHTNWVQTSFNARIRKNYAAIGHTYDVQRDAFIPQKPFASWVLDEATCKWNAPTPYPTDGISYDWDEATLAWKPQPSYPIVENTNGVRVVEDLPVTTMGGENA